MLWQASENSKKVTEVEGDDDGDGDDDDEAETTMAIATRKMEKTTTERKGGVGNAAHSTFGTQHEEDADAASKEQRLKCT